MNPIEFVLPGEIEKRSFEIISEELEKRHIVLPKEQEPVTKRVIHTSADFDYAETMCYSDHAVEIAKEAAWAGFVVAATTAVELTLSEIRNNSQDDDDDEDDDEYY